MKAVVRRVAFVIALGAIAAGVACSLTDLSGFSTPETPDASAVDAATVDAVVVIDATSDVSPPSCKASMVIDSPLTTDLGTWSTRAHAQNGHPKVEAFFGTSAAVLFPFVDTTPIPVDAGDPDAGPTFFNPPEIEDAISALWQTTALPLRSFDVQLEAYVRCTKSGSCADGFAFAWLDTIDPSLLSNSNSGGAQGIPSGIDGAAVLLDDYQNDSTESSDPAVPSLEIVQVDRTKDTGAGSYPWVVTSRSTAFLGAWHTLAISVRGGMVSVRYDGGPPLSTTVNVVARGLIGLTSGTGGKSDAVAVRNFKGSFYDCVP